MTRQVGPFDPKALRARRQELGWSQARLAAGVGVSTRQIVNYENGQRSPSPARLAALASALSVPARVLAGVNDGDETLADLRRFAGLDRIRAAELLDQRLHGNRSRGRRWRLTAVETGSEVLVWQEPVALAKVIASLADIYSASPAAVRRAWCRVFPAHAALLDTASEPSSAAGEGAATNQAAGFSEWGALNSRQRTYLAAIFREDQQREQDVRLSVATSKRLGPASEWRKIPFTVHADPAFTGYTPLQARLRASGDLDAGAGATLRALARRGLLVISVDEVEVAPLGFVPRTQVELTRHGRRLVRAGLREPPRLRRPPQVLSEWLWRCLVLVAQAGDEGLPADRLQGKSRFYLGTGYRPRGHPSRGYIDLVAVHRSGSAASGVAERRWQLTERGRAHVTDYLPTYQALYPAIVLDTAQH